MRMMSAKLLVLSGTFVHSSGGERFPPTHEQRSGITPPWIKAALESVIGCFSSFRIVVVVSLPQEDSRSTDRSTGVRMMSWLRGDFIRFLV